MGADAQVCENVRCPGGPDAPVAVVIGGKCTVCGLTDNVECCEVCSVRATEGMAAGHIRCRVDGGRVVLLEAVAIAPVDPGQGYADMLRSL